jgi:hypothetical protein
MNMLSQPSRPSGVHVHVLDRVKAVRIELGRHAAGAQQHFAHGLAGDLHRAAANVERAHAAQVDRLLSEGRRCGKAEYGRRDEVAMHGDVLRCTRLESPQWSVSRAVHAHARLGLQNPTISGGSSITQSVHKRLE